MFPREYHVCYRLHLLLPPCEVLLACGSPAPSSPAGGARPQILASFRQHFDISLVGVCLTGELFPTLLFHKMIVSKDRYPTALVLDILLLPGSVTRLRHSSSKSEKIHLFSAHFLPLPSCTEIFVNDIICFEFVRLSKTFLAEQS